MAWRQDGEAAVLTCTKKVTVRKSVLTGLLTVRELKNGHFAYASGRANQRQDGKTSVRTGKPE